MTGTEHWAPLPDQLKLLGFNAADVTKIVIGHGHWDHAGQLIGLPERRALRAARGAEGIEWALNYPEPAHRAPSTPTKGGCARTPACGYTPLTLREIYGKVLARQGRDRRRRDGDRARA